MAPLDRRDALRRLALGGLGAASLPLWASSLVTRAEAQAHCAPPTGAASASEWTPKALTPAQDRTVTTLAELIIPETDTPGARAAFVNRYIDAILADAAPAEREGFLKGLAAVDERSRELFGAAFVEASPAQQTTLLAALACGEDCGVEDPAPRLGELACGPECGREEAEPKTFFTLLKDLTIIGYYTSEVALRDELGTIDEMWRGGFEGCAHPGHEAAAPPERG